MREMIIADKEQIKTVESPFGEFRWVEFAGQKWVARNDLVRAVGNKCMNFSAVTFSEENYMVAVREYLSLTMCRIGFLNAAGVREFEQIKLGRLKSRHLQKPMCTWLLENIFSEPKAEPKTEPPIKPLFDDMPSLAEAEQALATVAQFIHSLKGKKE